jgi:3-dehydroquinate synthase
MQRDKKNRGSTARFVVLDDVAKPTIMISPTTESLFSAFQEICE